MLGLHMVRWLLRSRQEASPIEQSCMNRLRCVEMETAKEILAEVFGVQVVEVKEMICSRLEERSWATERTHLTEDGLWPAMFCLRE